eukprot:TRINITY_DN7699_c0_g1_i1.p1 TRINITY_DN7699_c0_g1~~TRINITY_DN7699_c0_g1_i1.p1  ORF type:complete len:118 (-),score=33.89 TRINITY_DN7699_c0_g1_i1:136-450(-)
MSVIKIANLAEFKEQTSKDTLVVVDFFAVWCGPCKRISPFFVELAAKYPDVTFVKVDIDEAPDVAEDQEVSAMPTFRYFKSGKQVAELVGASKEKLEALVVENK